MGRYFIADNSMKGFVYGTIHDYISFEDRYRFPGDAMVYDSKEDAEKDIEQLNLAGFTDCFVVDDNMEVC